MEYYILWVLTGILVTTSLCRILKLNTKGYLPACLYFSLALWPAFSVLLILIWASNIGNPIKQ